MAAPKVLAIRGLQFVKISNKKWPYVVVKANYPHTLQNNPILGPAWPANNVLRAARTGVVVARITRTSITLYVNFAWDGNSGPARNTAKCLRASAIHDAWCQAMDAGLYKENCRNWFRGTSEYYSIARADGMGIPRARGPSTGAASA